MNKTMRTASQPVGDPCTALALGVIADAMETREGRRWIRSDRLAKFWSIEAGLEWSDLVALADRRDGYRPARWAA